MLVNEEIAQKFAKLALAASKQLAIESHKYIGIHTKIYGYTKYPVKQELFDRSNPEYAKMFEIVPFLAYDIPRYFDRDHPKDFIDYSGIFYNFTDDRLDCEELDTFGELMEYVESESDLIKVIVAQDKQTNLKYRLRRIVTDSVVRYLYTTKATESVPEDIEQQLSFFICDKILRYLSKELQILIYIPICLATFEEDDIVLADGIRIVRISDEIQKARQHACQYESNREDWVAACATHMIVLENYHFNNTGDLSINSLTQNYNVYPIQQIDNIMATIRIVTGYSIGYLQILTCPVGWIEESHADLIPLYGAKAHFVNPKETEKMWLDLPVYKVDKDQIELIKQVYLHVVECESQNKSNILFALKRFNRCNLRNEVDDTATDATIGLEALLAGGTKSEITYTISNRIPIVFSQIKSDLYTPINSRSIMKKIYHFRSKIVHGGSLKEKETAIEINGQKIDICDVAVDFLRYTLWFMLEHQEFLDPIKIDEQIDTLFTKCQLKDLD